MDFGAWYLELRGWLIQHPDAILIAVFLTALIEAVAVIGTIVPAVPLLFVLSVLAAHAEVGLLPLFAVGMAGAMAGDSISYALGQNFQHRIHQMWPFSRYPDWLNHSEEFVKKHGGKGIIFGRFIGPLRAFVPMAAGIFRMKPIYFLWMNFLSALAWAPTHLLPGYSLGAATAHDWMPGRPQLLLLGALLILVAVLTWLLPALDTWRQRRAAGRELANTGRAFCHDGRPEDQRAALRLALFAFAGFMLVACLLPWLKPWDILFTGQIFAFRQSVLDPVFVVLSILGDTRGLLVFGAVLVGWLALRREWTLAAFGLLVAALGLSLPNILKQLFDIARPVLVMAPPGSESFPSGHAFSAVLVWGFVLVMIDRYGREPVTGLARPALLAITLLTITARPYLGVHWVSDVLAGALLGLACLALLRWSWYRRPAPRISLGELLLVLTLALTASVMLEVVPRFHEGLINYQPLPGLLPNYLLLP
ncbi:MAG: bifunctional DedA family/phosphatase PAP2 family protein [Pedobacter sp.]|nr:bifunctional DedA family/phosphatase PAP2 family protein [Pedobacter sp.]